MNKTPVSVLQEMMVKNHSRPDYELVYDGGGTHINTFTYRVTCDGLSATGTGRCKKDAKHEAAKAMLETIAKHRGYLQLPASPAQSPVRTPVPPTIPIPPRIPPNVPFLNAIGALQDLCSENNLQDPEYHLISDIGPPHARVFTIQCEVATFKEEGVATTKKLAKHEAAKKMLERINDLVADFKNGDSAYSMENEETRRKEIIANEIAKSRYHSLCKLQSKKVNLGLRLSECHLNIRNSLDNERRQEVINKLYSFIPKDINDISEELLEDILTELTTYLSTLNFELTRMVELSANEMCAAALRINTCPEIVSIKLAKTQFEALVNTTIHFIKSMILLLE